MSSIKTTIKTDLCSFSELRIYPGRGKKFIARDGKVYIFINSKTSRLAAQKKKAARLVWTQPWRRCNKKIRIETGAKRKTKRAGKTQKAIVGLSLDDIKKKRALKPDIRQAARDLALKEAREKQQARALKKNVAGGNMKMGVAGGKKDVAALKGNVSKGGAVAHKQQTGGRKK